MRTAIVIVADAPTAIIACIIFVAWRSVPGKIVVTVGAAALLFPFGSPNSGELSAAEALLVIVPPVALATTPVTVTGGYDPINAGPEYVHVTVNADRTQV